MQRSVWLLLGTLGLSGCPESTTAPLPPAGMAGGPSGAAPSPYGVGSNHGLPPGHVSMGAASQPAYGGQGGAAASPHGNGFGAPGAASQAALPTIVPGGGAEGVAAAAELSGTIAEAHHVKEYTYMRVTAEAGGDAWAAVLKDETLTVGTHVSLGKDIWMTDFQSPSLGRSFDRILFGRVVSRR
ncbi:MAG: hypothetical protein ACO3JL_06120 [Myxococcota bacterium]